MTEAARDADVLEEAADIVAQLRPDADTYSLAGASQRFLRKLARELREAEGDGED